MFYGIHLSLHALLNFDHTRDNNKRYRVGRREEGKATRCARMHATACKRFHSHGRHIKDRTQLRSKLKSPVHRVQMSPTCALLHTEVISASLGVT